MSRKSKRLRHTVLFVALLGVFLLSALSLFLVLNGTVELRSQASIQAQLSNFSLVTKDSLNLYTANEQEKLEAVRTHGFTDARGTVGKIFSSPQANTVPLQRFNTGSAYFYTASQSEADSLKQYNWTYEGIAGYVYPRYQTGTVALSRLTKGSERVLASETSALQQLLDNGYSNDGVVGYIYPANYVAPVANTKPVPSQLGAVFFYWYDCPSSTYQCDTSKIPYMPSNYQNYSADNVSWFKSEFAEMSRAGVDIIIAASWGNNHPSIANLRDSQALPLMVQALKENNSSQKVALLDDTNSVVAEWNVDQGGVYSNPTENPTIPKMPLSNDRNWSYFYDRKMKPFYQSVPKEYWATHNGLSIEQGGQPLVLIYDGARSFSNLEYSDEMWFAIKNAFKQDFGVTPFIVLDYSWFDYNTEAAALEKIVDGKFIWSGGNDSLPKKYTLKNFTSASVDAGFVCPSWSIYAGCSSKDRHVNPLTGKKGNGERLKGLFAQAQGSNLILLETWNELNEGSGVGLSRDYKDQRGRALPASFYRDLVSNLKQKHVSK